MRYFSFEGKCKNCHQKMNFCVTFENNTYDLLFGENIQCYQCGHEASPYDLDQIIYMIERLDIINERNTTLEITQISIRDVITAPPEDEEL